MFASFFEVCRFFALCPSLDNEKRLQRTFEIAGCASDFDIPAPNRTVAGEHPPIPSREAVIPENLHSHGDKRAAVDLTDASACGSRLRLNDKRHHFSRTYRGRDRHDLDVQYFSQCGCAHTGSEAFRVACADAQSDSNSEPETRMDARGGGYDAEDVDRDIAAYNARADELGLVFDSDPRHELPTPAPTFVPVRNEPSVDTANAGVTSV